MDSGWLFTPCVNMVNELFATMAVLFDDPERLSACFMQHRGRHDRVAGGGRHAHQMWFILRPIKATKEMCTPTTPFFSRTDGDDHVSQVHGLLHPGRKTRAIDL